MSPEGLNSPLRQLGLDAAADPNWVAGPFGFSYLSAIAFERSAVPGTGTGGNSVVFIQKYQNSNNVENDPNPLKPVGAPVILTAGMGMKFHDKPWAAVSSLGSLHIVWAAFPAAPEAPTKSEIWHAVCPLGDVTRCVRRKISQGDFIFNGAAIAIDPVTLWADITYRRHKSTQPVATDALLFVRCFPPLDDDDDGYHECTNPVVVTAPPELKRADNSAIAALFDQGSSTGTFPIFEPDDSRRRGKACVHCMGAACARDRYFGEPKPRDS